MTLCLVARCTCKTAHLVSETGTGEQIWLEGRGQDDKACGGEGNEVPDKGDNIADIARVIGVKFPTKEIT